MLQVRFIKGIAGKGFSYGKDAVAWVAPKAGRGFIRNGVAVLIKEEKKQVIKVNKPKKRKIKKK